MLTKSPELNDDQPAAEFVPPRRRDVKDGSQVPVTSYKPGWLQVNSFSELMRHEKEILDRIAYTENGGNLFMAHPLMLLDDIGVQLSEDAKKELIEREPLLGSLSDLPYQAIKFSRTKQPIRFHLHGLFKRS